MKKNAMTSVERQAVWERCRHWQDSGLQEADPPEKTKKIQLFAKEENHDHEFKNINNHDHDQRQEKKETRATSELKHDGKTLFRIVNQDPDFILAVSWGLWPQALFNACQTYGVPRVREAIRLVKAYTGVKNPAAYCMAVIKSPPVAKR
jgi:hypothetical protein